MSYSHDATNIHSKDDLNASEPPQNGTYHLVITNFKDSDDGKAFSLTLQILAGTDESQIGRTFFENVIYPSVDHKDGGEFARKRITKLLLATRLMSEKDLGKCIDVELSDLDGLQLVAKVKRRSYTGRDGSEKTAAGIDGLNMYDPLDPEVANVPRDAEYLGVLPPLEDSAEEDEAPAPEPAKPTPPPAKATTNGNGAKPAVRMPPRKPAGGAASASSKYDID